MALTVGVISTTGTFTTQTIEGDVLSGLQSIVGGYIQIIPGPRDDVDFVVNEEGLVEGLPLNTKASVSVGYPLLGNVAVIGAEITDDGEMTSMPGDFSLRSLVFDTPQV